MQATEFAIVAQDVHKRYAGGIAGAGLNGFTLNVASGSVCGLLGPNGAGKTTAIKVLSTLLEMDSGAARVAGYDVRTQAQQVRTAIGLVGQFAAVDEILTSRQNLVMFGELYHLAPRHARQRADELLEQFGLTDASTISAGKLSGGMRRRLDIAVSLIVSPSVLFVDEPTTGLDPMGRREVWAVIQSLVAGGTTVLLTTQHLEEADHLAHRIAMLKEGRVIVEGTPDALKSAYGADWIDMLFSPDVDLDRVRAIVQPIASGEVRVERESNRVSLPITARTRALVTVAKALAEAQLEPEDLVLRRPTLDEVFIHLTTTSDSLTERATTL